MSQLLCLHVIIIMRCKECLQNKCSSLYMSRFVPPLWSQTLSRGISLGRNLKTNPSWGAINQNGLPFVSIADGPIAPIKRRGGERGKHTCSKRQREKQRQDRGAPVPVRLSYSTLLQISRSSSEPLRVQINDGKQRLLSFQLFVAAFASLLTLWTNLQLHA